MPTSESLTTDILVIGSGVAGMMAALEARRGGASVTMVTKSGMGKEASTAYAKAAFHPPDSKEGVNLPGFDNRPGKYIEDPEVVEVVKREAMGCIDLLQRTGVRVATEIGYDGITTIYHPAGSDLVHGGAIILDGVGRVLRDSGIRVIENCLVTQLLKDEGRVTGMTGLLDDGCWLSAYARITLLATGGGAGIYENTTTSKSVLGGGYGLALRAGATLSNLEFIHYYPVGLRTPGGQYVHCAPPTLLMEGAMLVNGGGEDIIRKQLRITLQQGTIPSSTRFEWLPRAVAKESNLGPVFLDLTRVPEAVWQQLPERNHRQIRRTGVDMRKEPVQVIHMGHSFRGGIPVNSRGHTSLEGLYAAGEVTSGYFAAERGWGPFPSCMITGAIAGRAAAEDLLQTRQVKVTKAPADGLAAIAPVAGRQGGRDARELLDATRNVCYRYAGPIKSGPALEQGLRDLATLEEAVEGASCNSMADAKALLEEGEMLTVGRAVMQAALLRQESRGAHYREDFPDRDDVRWLRPVLVSYDATQKRIKAEAGRLVSYSATARTGSPDGNN